MQPARENNSSAGRQVTVHVRTNRHHVSADSRRHDTETMLTAGGETSPLCLGKNKLYIYICVCVCVCVCVGKCLAVPEAMKLVGNKRTPSSHRFLDAFATFRKATINFVMSVRPHGRTRFPLDGFS